MAFQDSQYGDIHANLAISQVEACSGSSRVINLPGGRSVNVIVPAGIGDGEEIRLRGQGDPVSPGGMAGDLVLRVKIIAADLSHSPATFQDQQTFVGPTEEMAAPPIMQSRPDHLVGGVSSMPSSNPGAYYAALLPTEAVNYPYQPGQVSGNPQSYAGYPPYPQYQGYTQTHGQTYPPQYLPPQQQLPQPRPQKRSGALTAAIIVLVVTLLVCSGLIFYLAYYHPHQVQADATTTAQTQATSTANSAANSTAQAAQGTADAVETATGQTQATATAYQNIYTQATSQTPTFQDSMSGQTDRQWDRLTSSVNGTCDFVSGSYHSKMPSVGYFQPCFAENTNFSNFAFQVTMSMIQGNAGGLLFRATNASNKFYLFRVSTSGTYDLFLYGGVQTSQVKTLLHGTTDSIRNGQANTITVVASGSNLNFYVNQHYVDGISDGTYAAGQIGVFADASDQAAETAFSNIEVWSL